MARRRSVLRMFGLAPFGPAIAGAAAGPAATAQVPMDDPAIRVIENVWIPMADGARPAARLFLPVTAGQVSCGAVLEYLPYRKRDGNRYRDDVVGPFWPETA